MIPTQECATTINHNCPSCQVEVCAAEIADKKCGKCGAALDTPVQNVAVTVNPLPIFTAML